MITTLTGDDLVRCAALYTATFNAPPWSESWRAGDALQRLTDFLDTPRSTGVCLSTPDGELLGFALGHTERAGADDHFLLQEMCVSPAVQRHGHGTALLAALADRLPAVRGWYLLTARGGPAAAFYERNGFRPAGRMAVFVRN
ncbi:MAG TPA: GNAT family N-acetyltransferase [Actinoplanes sp.]|nr:GNAT family N-acetyltransferase [Actinoplanes sp.]